MDWQYSSSFQLVQPLITPLATFADVPRAGTGPVSGCEELCLDIGARWWWMVNSVPWPLYFQTRTPGPVWTFC